MRERPACRVRRADAVCVHARITSKSPAGDLLNSYSVDLPASTPTRCRHSGRAACPRNFRESGRHCAGRSLFRFPPVHAQPAFKLGHMPPIPLSGRPHTRHRTVEHESSSRRRSRTSDAFVASDYSPFVVAGRKQGLSNDLPIFLEAEPSRQPSPFDSKPFRPPGTCRSIRLPHASIDGLFPSRLYG